MNRYSHKLILTAGLFALSSSIAQAQLFSPVVTHTLSIVPGLGSSNALAFTRTGGNGNVRALFNGPLLNHVGQGNLNGLLSSGDRGNRIGGIQVIGDIDVNVLNGIRQLTP